MLQPRHTSRAPWYIRSRASSPAGAGTSSPPARLTRAASVTSSTMRSADARVPADPAVEAALDQHVAAGGDGDRAAARARQRPGRDEGADRRRGRRQDRPLGGSLGHDGGEERHAAPPEPQRHRERPTEGVGRVEDVGVGEEQPLAAGGPHPLPAGPGLADPAWRERLAAPAPAPAGRRQRRRAPPRAVPSRDSSSTTITSRGPYSRARRLRIAAPDVALLVAGRDDHAHEAGRRAGAARRPGRGATRRSWSASAAAPAHTAAATPAGSDSALGRAPREARPRLG